jgi:hypothetical protein
MAPSRNVDSWKKRHQAKSGRSQLYADPVPDVASLKAQDLDEEETKMEILELDVLQLGMDPTWDATVFNKISVVTPGMEKAVDVKFDVQFPTSFNFTEDIFTADKQNYGERVSTPIPMTPDSNRSFNLEMEDPPVVSTERESDDAESQTSDVFDDLPVDDPSHNEIPRTTSNSGIVSYSNLKDTEDMIPDGVYSSSDSEEESADSGDKEMNKGHTSIQTTHHRDQRKNFSIFSLWKKKKRPTDALIDEVDMELSGSPLEILKEKSPPADDEDCDDIKENESDEESSDEDDIVPSPERRRNRFFSVVSVLPMAKKISSF